MYLATVTDAVYQTLSACEALADASVIRAFPYVKKPLRMKTPVLCVSPSGVQASRAALGGECFMGEYGVDIDLFVPHCLGSPVAETLLEKAAAAVCAMGITHIRIGAIRSENALDSFTAKCTVTFCAPFNMSEETIWKEQRN